MAVKRSVFASNAERLNYLKLSRTWGDKFRIYHNLPFLNVFDLEDVIDFDLMQNFRFEALSMTQSEKEYLKKTSIDYTLCNENDEPLICVEFDGWQDGKNVGTKYYANKRHDPFRQMKLDLKLKVAFGSLFPYIIVGYHEFEDLDPDVRLTIVDGIIGNILAGKYARERISRGVTPKDLGLSDSEYKQMHSWEVEELLIDWANGVEIEAELSLNPIKRQIDYLQDKLGAWSRETRLLFSGAVGKGSTFVERIQMQNESLFVGASAVVDAHDYKNVRSEIWLSNFNTIGLSLTTVLFDIAELLALVRLKWLRESGSPK